MCIGIELLIRWRGSGFRHAIIEDALERYGTKGALSSAQTLAEEFSIIERFAQQQREPLLVELSAVQAKLKELQTMLRSMSEAVLAIDSQERIVTLNDSAMELFKITDMQQSIGQDIRKVIRNSSIQELCSRALLEKDHFEDEIRLVLETGKKVLQVHCSPLSGDSGKVEGAVIVFHDISELKRLEEMRKEFVANVSHELRTPITSIKGFVETLIEAPDTDQESQQRFLGIIAKHSDRLSAIIEDLLQLSRLEQQRDKELERSPMTPTSLFRAVSSVCEATLEKHGSTLEQEFPPDLEILVNGPLLEQALINLVQNAARYNPPGTRVTLLCEKDKENIRIEVRDDGRGIEKKHLSRLFERFYRVDSGRSREAGGTGLGLAIVKHIARAHGGSAFVESEIGKGSRFGLLLPDLKTASSSRTQAAEENPLSSK